MKKIAVIGNLSSGKTTVCQFFRSLGAYTVSADEIVHTLLEKSALISQKVIQLLGAEIQKEGKINRQAVAERVFANDGTLDALEKILHPAVFDEIALQYALAKDNPQYIFFVAEVPLLYEANGESFFDSVITVLAKKEICKARFMNNTSHTKRNFTQRNRRQWPSSLQALRSTYTIYNNGSLEELQQQITKLTHILSDT